MATDRPHIVQFERRRAATSATLAPADVSSLLAVARAVPWYRERWSYPPFRKFLLDFMKTRAPGGLVLLGPRIRFAVPPPFDELFEPIELRHGLGFGVTDPQLQTLSGQAPTREERQKRIAYWLLSPIVLLAIVMFVVGLWRVGPAIVLPIGMIVVAAVGFGLTLAAGLSRIGGRWFLVPGGVAIVRSHGPLNQRLVLRTRRDTPVIIRYASNGKTVFLVIELWSAEGRKWRRPVSDREAISFLAAWQSVEATPMLEQLREALGVTAAEDPG